MTRTYKVSVREREKKKTIVSLTESSKMASEPEDGREHQWGAPPSFQQLSCECLTSQGHRQGTHTLSLSLTNTLPQRSNFTIERERERDRKGDGGSFITTLVLPLGLFVPLPLPPFQLILHKRDSISILIPPALIPPPPLIFHLHLDTLLSL